MVASRFVRADGVRLWTESVGDPADPPVLLVMGTSAQAIAWPDEFVELLVGRRRFVIRFDHRDVGASDTVDVDAVPYTSDDMALDAQAVLDGYGLASAHLVGVSLGGALVQWLAVHRTERVRTLTAIATTMMNYDPAPAWQRAFAGHDPDPEDLPPPAPEFLWYLTRRSSTPHTRQERIASAVEMERILAGEVFPVDVERARRLAERSLERTRDPDAANHHHQAGVLTAARQASLSSIAAPALVIHGSADPLYPSAHGRALAQVIPNARFLLVPGMGHTLQQPEIWHTLADAIVKHTSAQP